MPRLSDREFTALLARAGVSQAAFARLTGVHPPPGEQVVPRAGRRARLGRTSGRPATGSLARGAADHPRGGDDDRRGGAEPRSREHLSRGPIPLPCSSCSPGELSQLTERLRGPTELTKEERHCPKSMSAKPPFRLKLIAGAPEVAGIRRLRPSLARPSAPNRVNAPLDRDQNPRNHDTLNLEWAGRGLRRPPAPDAESARGVSPRAAHRSGHEPLDSSGSCHPPKTAAFR